MKILVSLSSVPDVLYHATYKPYLKKIKIEGLHGNNKRKNYSESKAGLIYLADTRDIAESYAETSDTVPESYLDQIIVFEIETKYLNKSKLRRDANVQVDENTKNFTWEYTLTIPYKHLTLV